MPRRLDAECTARVAYPALLMSGHDTPVVRLDAAEVVEGGKHILGPIDWVVERAQRWVVLGPNGAGKSTLVRLVGGWRLPTRGSVRVLGERFGTTDLRDLRPRIGWVSGELERRLLPTMPVREVVLTGRHAALVRWRQVDTPADEARAEALLAWVGCAELADRQFGTLSDGERQRVLVARALLPEPELLLLDEPFAGLDLAGRELLVAALAEVAADPTAPPAVLVTHHAEDIPPGFTDALLLRDGHIVASGPLDDVLTDTAVSDTFGVAVHVEQHAGRYATRASALHPTAAPATS
jgi:iron complex transport system ATP-binding protein